MISSKLIARASKAEATGTKGKQGSSSQKAQIRIRLKGTFDMIANGKTPTEGVIDGTEPGYWILSTYQQDPLESTADWCALKNTDSKKQFEAWVNRGGRSEGFRFTPSDRDDTPEDWIGIWLVDAKSGNWCLGISFPAWDKNKSVSRCFQLVERDLTRNPKTLLECLNRRKAFGLDLRDLKCLLKWAPCQVVMPNMSSSWKSGRL
jgi:hypothetical protein